MAGKTSAVIVTATCLLAAICAAGFCFLSHGVTAFAKIECDAPEHCSQKDMDAAVQIVKAKFRSDFDGCIMQKLVYCESEVQSKIEYGSEYAGVIVLRADYLRIPSLSDIEFSGGSGECEWIVVQNTDGLWELKAFGPA